MCLAARLGGIARVPSEDAAIADEAERHATRILQAGERPESGPPAALPFTPVLAQCTGHLFAWLSFFFISRQNTCVI